MTDLKEIPFFFHSTETPDNEGMPKVFPFGLYFHEEYQMFCQRSSAELNELLRQVYEKGSLADGSFSSASGKIYVERITEYILKTAEPNEHSAVLEIGFGSGIILKSLKEKGLNRLHGIEPGNHPREEGLEDVRLVRDFFPSAGMAGMFDLIYSLLVLEHVENPVVFLRDMGKQLNPGGKVVIAVPNCGPYYSEGDISMFIHEHFGYYNTAALRNVSQMAGFSVLDIQTVEGALVATLEKSKSGEEKKEMTDISLFAERMNRSKTEVHKLLLGYKQEDVAVYAPIRAMNLLSQLRFNRIIPADDNPQMRGRFLPAFDHPVVSFDDLCAQPPRLILVFSRTFGERIKEKCRNAAALSQTRVLSLSDLD